MPGRSVNEERRPKIQRSLSPILVFPRHGSSYLSCRRRLPPRGLPLGYFRHAGARYGSGPARARDLRGHAGGLGRLRHALRASGCGLRRFFLCCALPRAPVRALGRDCCGDCGSLCGRRSSNGDPLVGASRRNALGRRGHSHPKRADARRREDGLGAEERSDDGALHGRHRLFGRRGRASCRAASHAFGGACSPLRLLGACVRPCAPLLESRQAAAGRRGDGDGRFSSQ